MFAQRTCAFYAIDNKCCKVNDIKMSHHVILIKVLAKNMHLNALRYCAK